MEQHSDDGMWQVPGELVLPAVGVDVVSISAFGQQLDQPGTAFENVFSSRELRRAAQYVGRRRVEHLAGRWAAKEAFVKAWSQALYGRPPVVEIAAAGFGFLEVTADAWGRVAVTAKGAIADAVHRSLGPVVSSLSISHDGDVATAVVVLSRHTRAAHGGRGM